MAIYEYVNKQGQLATIEAGTPDDAMRLAAPYADPSSGVALRSSSPGVTTTPTQPTPTTPAPIVNRPPTPTQPQPTGPNLPAFQTPQQQPQWLPQNQQSSTGSLMEFASALDQAVALATKSRNQNALGIMMPAQGTVAASDFSSILSSMNQASNSFSTNLVDRAMKAATPTYQTQQIGNQLVQMAYDGSGKFIGASPIAILPEEYQYDTMTLANGDVYYIQKDSTGKPIGQQLVYQNPEAAKSTYKYETDKQGNIQEWVYDQNGQLTTVQTVGTLPKDAAGIEYVQGTTGTYQDGAGIQWFQGQKTDGEWVNIKLGGAASQSSGSSANSFKFSSTDKQLLLGANFTAQEITNIESDVSEYGLQAVLEDIQDPTQKAALTQALTGQKPEETSVITKEYLEGYFGDAELQALAAEKGYRSVRTNWATEKETFLAALVAKAEQLREAGYSDKEILKAISGS